MSARGIQVHKPHRKTHQVQERPAFDCVALLLQGGGALGAYQAGVYEALAEAHLHPDWVAGISIGAINSALIAGNPPEARVEKLRAFWQLITAPPVWGAGLFPFHADTNPMWNLIGRAGAALAKMGSTSLPTLPRPPATPQPDPVSGIWQKMVVDASCFWSSAREMFGVRGDVARSLVNQLSAGLALAYGAPGFFGPRLSMPWLQPAGTVEATSFYDTAPLRATLERLVDFDRINAGDIQFSVGAVNVATGNFVYFDNRTHTIRPEHVMASGALPPGFSAVEVDGEYYWDGGLVSNTPLEWVLESGPRCDTLAFQVDLWSARGELPRTMPEAMTRQKEIQYSSRTRANSDRFKYAQKMRNALSSLLRKLPDELKDSPELAVLCPAADYKVYNLIQLIYRSKRYEGDSKDYEFSCGSMEDHWRAGYLDTVRTLRHPEVLERPTNGLGVFTFDVARDGRE